MMVCIDPGHGGKDPGAIAENGKIREKDINLQAALWLKKLLEPEFKTALTRETDEYISLSGRCAFANVLKADYFISLHCNSFKDTNANGVIPFILARGGKAEVLANEIQNQLKSKLKSRSVAVKEVRCAPLYVLRKTDMPAVLLEMGFISNPVERKLLVTVDFQILLMRAVAEALRCLHCTKKL